MEQKANITIDKEHITVERTQTACGRHFSTAANRLPFSFADCFPG